MINEHERAVLIADLPENNLEAGNVGTVVHVYDDGAAYEIEFFAPDGRTLDVVTLEASQVRAISPRYARMQDLDDLRKLSRGDVAHAIGKAAIAFLPIVGGAVAEAYELALVPPQTKRWLKFVTELEQSLYALEKRVEGFEVQSLQDNESFESIRIQATFAAIKTHQEEKIRNLRNAVLNAALPESPDYSEEQTFVRWVDEFTVWHVKLLKLFTRRAMPYLNLDQGDWRMNMGVDETFSVVCDNYPEMQSRFDLFLTILADLEQIGLIGNIHPFTDEPSEITQSPEITRLGKAFLKFLESPLDD